MSVIEELQAAVTGIAGSAGPSIVGIGRHTRGSGVVIATGKVLTNAHNLRGDEVTVSFADGRRETGRVSGVDGEGDLAVIEVDTGGAASLTWGDGSSLAIGTPVFGAAASEGGATRVTFGLVSAVAQAFRGPGGRRISGSVEHTAPLAPGSSGGALLDGQGRLVGLNTNRIGEGFYLALPADADLQARVDALARGESPSRLRLGVAVMPGHVARRMRRSVGLPDRAGVLVRGVEEDGLADAAGIEAGDLIVSVGGREVTDTDDLMDALASAKVPFPVAVVRGSEERTVSVEAAEPKRTPGDA
jgi:serine protease Do